MKIYLVIDIVPEDNGDANIIGAYTDKKIAHSVAYGYATGSPLKDLNEVYVHGIELDRLYEFKEIL